MLAPSSTCTSDAASAPNNWKAIDTAIVKLAARRGEHDLEEGRLLVAAQRETVHLKFGFARYTEYVEHRLGYDPRTTVEKLRVAKALMELPRMREALRSGERPWSAVRELTRIVVPDTEAEWLEASAGKTIRDIERLVAGHHPGDKPSDPTDPTLVKRMLQLQLSPEILARFRDGIAQVRKTVDPNLSEAEALDVILQQYLDGKEGEPRPPYQSVLGVCERCQRTTQISRGEAIEVSNELAERAACDCETLPHAHGHAHVGAPPAVEIGGSWRVTKSVTPAIRRQVLARDQGRCRVPGCRNTHWLQLHHLNPQHEGGAHDPENLITLCGTHHRLAHEGRVVLTGPASQLLATHADGTPYGHPARPAAVAHNSDAFAALKSLEFGDTRAHSLLAEARAHVGADASTDNLVRAALRASRGMLAKDAPPRGDGVYGCRLRLLRFD